MSWTGFGVMVAIFLPTLLDTLLYLSYPYEWRIRFANHEGWGWTGLTVWVNSIGISKEEIRAYGQRS